MKEMTFNYGSKTISFTLSYRKRKTMEIRVEPPGKVSVVAPLGTPEEIILARVSSKAEWIVQKQFALKDVAYRPLKREFVSGESFMYLGRNYTLQIHIDKTLDQPLVKLFQGRFHITSPTKDQAEIKKALEEWYWVKTKEKVTERIKYYQHLFNIQPAAVKVKNQRKRWASCTGKNALLFNWRCSMACAPALDYIVVHEMCHLVHKNHSPAYWDLVATIMPDYQWRRDWLQKYGVRMDL